MISVMAMGCASDLPPNSGTGSSNLSGGESSSIEDDGSSEEENSSSEKKDDLESDEYENDGGWMN